TVTRMVPETIVKKVPYTVTRMQTEVVKKQIPYTTTRVVCGAYVDVDEKGNPLPSAKSATAGGEGSCGNGGCGNGGCGNGLIGHDCEGPNRKFIECAAVETTYTTTTTRMVPEVCKKKIQVTVWQTVTQPCVKRVPYTVTRMVPHTVTKTVPYTVCEMQTQK